MGRGAGGVAWGSEIMGMAAFCGSDSLRVCMLEMDDEGFEFGAAAGGGSVFC